MKKIVWYVREERDPQEWELKYRGIDELLLEWLFLLVRPERINVTLETHTDPYTSL
jgi:hypothetical protein